MSTFSIWNLIIVFLYLLPALLGLFVFKQRAIILRNKESGIGKKARLGWSWTYFYFGFWVPLFRGEIGIAALHLLFTLITLGLFQPICSFLYNKQHITRLLTNGWELNDSPEVTRFVEGKLMINAK